MGMFDDITVGDRSGQVKLWDRLLTEYGVGDEVPHLMVDTYSIAMREGGFVNIAGHRLISWTDEPTYRPIVDKYGSPFDETTRGELDGILPDPYAFKGHS
jgi:hypothetical protein